MKTAEHIQRSFCPTFTRPKGELVQRTLVPRSGNVSIETDYVHAIMERRRRSWKPPSAPGD